MSSLSVKSRAKRSELKDRITLIALCLLVLTGLLASCTPRPAPTRGFCPFPCSESVTP